MRLPSVYVGGRHLFFKGQSSFQLENSIEIEHNVIFQAFQGGVRRDIKHKGQTLCVMVMKNENYRYCCFFINGVPYLYYLLNIRNSSFIIIEHILVHIFKKLSLFLS